VPSKASFNHARCLAFSAGSVVAGERVSCRLPDGNHQFSDVQLLSGRKLLSGVRRYKEVTFCRFTRAMSQKLIIHVFYFYVSYNTLYHSHESCIVCPTILSVQYTDPQPGFVSGYLAQYNSLNAAQIACSSDDSCNAVLYRPAELVCCRYECRTDTAIASSPSGEQTYLKFDTGISGSLVLCLCIAVHSDLFVPNLLLWMKL
jgi:hypothetical protein